MKSAERLLAEKWLAEMHNIAHELEVSTSEERSDKAHDAEERLLKRMTRRLRPWTGR